MSRFVVMTASAHVPSSWKWYGTYRRVAVVETDLEPPFMPAMISDRAKGVVRVVQTWERLNVGKTERDAYSKALAEAGEFATFLNDRAAAEAKELERKLKRRVQAHARRMIKKLHHSAADSGTNLVEGGEING